MKTNYKNFLILGISLIFMLILSACDTGSTATPAVSATVIPPDAVIAEGHLVPKDDLYLSFAARGKVALILVEKGDTVKQGELLIQLADRQQAEAALVAAQTELTAAQQAYDDFVRLADFAHAQSWRALLDAQTVRAAAQTAWDDLDTDAIDDRIDEAEAEVNDTAETLKDAQDDFDKYADLSENNASRQDAKDTLDAAQKDYNAALRLLEETQREKDLPRATLDEALGAEAEARRTFENTLSGPDAEQLALVEGRLNSAKAQVAAAENGLSNYELRAPFDGTVADINVSVNEMIGPETWAVLVADFSQWYVETSDLTELKVVKTFEGQQATVAPDALPDLQISATVEEINQNFYIQGGDISYKLRLRLDEADPQLRWGMTVEITFQPQE